MRAVFCILDGFPPAKVSATLTPTLAALRAAGRTPVLGATAVMTSATYPNHASFVTGNGPLQHGLWANHVPGAEGTVVKAATVGPGTPTMFDALRAAGVGTEAVVGDENLVGVCGLEGADAHWPPRGELPPEVPRDPYGYMLDPITIERQCRAAAGDADLLFFHVNEPDTFGHVYGPDSPEAHDTYQRTDARLAEVLDSLRPRWDDTVVVIVSDHGMSAITGPPIDIGAEVEARGLPLVPLYEGSGAVLLGDDPDDGRWVLGLDGVAGAALAAPGVRILWAETGRWFAPLSWEGAMQGIHGGADTQAQLAVVTGGHPAAGALAAAVARGGVQAPDWPVTLAGLFGVTLPAATGRDLLG